MSSARGARRVLVACVMCLGLLEGLPGCGGHAPAVSRTIPTTGGGSAPASWAAQTQALCRQKRAAIARLGYINITYAGIARVGLPAVKRLLARYLDRLLGVLREFARRQRRFTTPSSLVAIMSMVREVDRQSQVATVRLRTAVAHVTSATQLSAAFRVWLGTLHRLARRGDALARQLNLPACQSGTTAPTQ